MTKQAWDKIFQLEEAAESVLIHPRKNTLDGSSRGSSEQQADDNQTLLIITADKAVAVA